MALNEVIKEVMTGLKDLVQSETVVGKPTQIGDAILVPVTRVSIGFGAGGSDVGKDSERKIGVNANGTGGGASIEPIAFVLVSSDGKAQILPVHGSGSRTSEKIIDMIPEIIQLAQQLLSPKDEPSSGDEPSQP